jgi:hypothetical protein
LACDQLIVPDFAAHSGALAAVALGRAPDPPTDACSRALHRLRSHLATALHHGLRRLPARWAHDGEELANSMAADGLQELSRLLRAMQSEVLSPAASAPTAPAFMTLCALRQLHQEALETQRSTLRVAAGDDLGQVSETAASMSTSRNTSLS